MRWRSSRAELLRLELSLGSSQAYLTVIYQEIDTANASDTR